VAGAKVKPGRATLDFADKLRAWRAVQRELARLEASALVTVRRIATQKHYQANPDSPIFSELVSIARKTIGIAEPLRAALAPVASKISAAFVYGSVAKREDSARSDIDLMILSDQVTYADLYAAVESLNSLLGRQVNPVIYTRNELTRRRAEGNSFVQRALSQPKLWVIGSEHDPGP
jgi:predicted nucleotidyltransferase